MKIFLRSCRGLTAMLYLFILLLPALAMAQRTGKLSGTIRTNDNQALGFASVYLKNTKYGVMANEQGNFILQAPSGKYTLTVTYAGYTTSEKTVEIIAGTDTDIGDIVVNAASNQLREVVVADIETNKFAKKQSSTSARMPISNLENAQVYTVVSKEIMQELIATDFNSALASIPGTVVMNGVNDSGNDVTLRGFTGQATFRNGLALDSRTQTDIVNIERVEVLKGPSGTLFGGPMSTYGGVVNTITKKPFESFRGEVNYTTGSWGLNRFTADVNTPLNKDRTALLRINAAGHTTNSFKDAGFLRSTAFAASMSFKTSEKTTVRFDADIYVPTKNLNAYIRQVNKLSVSSMKDINLPYTRSLTSDDIGVTRTTINALAEVEHKISEKWTSRTTYQHSESGEKESIFFVPYFLNDNQIERRFRIFENYQLIVDNLQQNFNGEFKIGNVKNRVVIGADYFSRVNNDQSMTPAFQVYDVVTLDETTPWNPISRAVIQSKRSMTSYFKRASAYSVSAYASDVVDITDRLFAMASLRVDYYKSKETLTGGVKQGDDYDQTQFSPKFGLVFQPIKNGLSVFGNYTNGFKNIAPSVAEANGETVNWKPEQAFQLEGGVKMELFQGRLNSTISVYDILVKDKVVSVDGLTSTQDGDQKSKGFEIELIANPVKGLNFVAGYGYNDNRYKNDAAGNAGKRVIWTPANVGNFWLSYKLLNGKAKGLGAGAGGNYVDVVYLDVDKKFNVPSHTTFGATLFYDQAKYRVGLKVNNISDQKYWNFYGQAQNPREFVANISYKF